MNRNPYPLEAAFRGLVSPFERFMRRTSAGGIVLVAATAAAFALATWMGEARFAGLWAPKLGFSLGESGLSMPLEAWVNEGLMALFFLLVGLEIKREVLVGELSTLREALLPAAGAMGGVVLPALIYYAINAGTPAVAGWAIPTATDIAFAVGVLVLMSARVPRGAIVFITALAIADDLSAVLAIAFFYAHGLQWASLGLAGAIALLLALCNRAGIRSLVPYAILGVMLWWAMLHSGVHATIAGLLVSFAIPARSRDPDCASPLHRVEHHLTPWVAFGVVPLFALANAGIDLRGIEWREAVGNPVTLGVAVGLWIGKAAGIFAGAWLCVRLGFASLPVRTTWRHLFGCALLGGIGFTMSLFVGQLAFADPADVERARLGTVLGSLLAAACGLAWLRACPVVEEAPPPA